MVIIDTTNKGAPHVSLRKSKQRFYAREIIQTCQPGKPEYGQTRSQVCQGHTVWHLWYWNSIHLQYRQAY